MSQLTYGLFTYQTVKPTRKGNILFTIVYSVPKQCLWQLFNAYLLNE